LSIFIVSADRYFVNLDGSGSPVKGATGMAFSVDVVVGTEVVVEDVPPMVVVVVESANAPEAIKELAPSAIAIMDTRIFFIATNYRVGALARSHRQSDAWSLLIDDYTNQSKLSRPDAGYYQVHNSNFCASEERPLCPKISAV
jgi:hypothetical protein